MSADFTNFDVPYFNGFESAMDNEENCYVENYFEYDHEIEQCITIESSNSASSESGCHWHSPQEETNETMYSLRKSMSTGNLLIGKEDERKEELYIHQNHQISQCDAEIGTKLQREDKNMKKVHKNSTRYVSMAEMAAKFWTQTPERFRVKPKTEKFTIPHTPQLHTKNRSRPVTALSKDQIEEIEMREAQKHQFKAHPLNKKILERPKVAMPLLKKFTTIPKPFKLTETHTKKVEHGPVIAQFHARAIPKSIYVAPKQLRVPLIPNPKLTRSNSKTAVIEKPPTPTKPLTTTQLEPFSFDQRDKEIVKHKEILRNKVIEEEKKAREFRARPIPKSVLIKKQDNGSASSIKSSKSEEDSYKSDTKQFKATYPKVLYQEPFIPKRGDERPLVEISPFYLNTEVRAKEREEYNKKLQEKQEEMNRIRAMREEEEKEKEQNHIQVMRKNIQFKANPIRQYKEVHIHPSGRITVPRSPNFKSSKVDKENVSQ